tara:strand:- start:3036 stop:3170 length:135 start_codon:yes stop_codon:yes gene_type:complete
MLARLGFQQDQGTASQKYLKRKETKDPISTMDFGEILRLVTSLR